MVSEELVVDPVPVREGPELVLERVAPRELARERVRDLRGRPADVGRDGFDRVRDGLFGWGRRVERVRLVARLGALARGRRADLTRRSVRCPNVPYRFGRGPRAADRLPLGANFLRD